MAPVDELKVDGLSIPCTDDYDCPYSALCYFLDAANPTSGFCGCDAEYGNIGDKCDEPSTQMYARVAALSIVIGAAALSMFLPILGLWQIRKRNGLSVSDVRTTTLIACILCFVFQILFYSTSIYNLLNPGDIEPESSISLKKKRAPSRIRSFGLVGFAFFFISSVLNVSILWLEIAIKSKKFKKIANPQLSKHYRYAVFAFDIVLAVFVATLSYMGSSHSLTVAAGILILIAFSYAYSAYAITAIIGSSVEEVSKERLSTSAASLRMQKSLARIRLCAIRVFVFLIVWIIALGAGAFLSPRITKTMVPKGDIIPHVLISDICALSSTFALISVVLFLWRPESSGSSEEHKQTNSSNNNTPNHGGETSNNTALVNSAKVHELSSNMPPS